MKRSIDYDKLIQWLDDGIVTARRLEKEYAEEGIYEDALRHKEAADMYEFIKTITTEDDPLERAEFVVVEE